MATEETVATSPLDKPLQFLTEDDISQLTREDCRRYLKEKGMRRPSWNKSQAIQQVISLKRLLESTPESDAGARNKLLSAPRAQNSPIHASISTSGDENVGELEADEPVLHRQIDLERSDHGGDLVPLRYAGVPNGPPGQMTIFYSGKVNVYNDVPTAKARSIMQLAACPLQSPKAVLLEENTSRQFGGIHFHPTNIKQIQDSPALAMPTPKAGFIGNINNSCRLQWEDSGTFSEDNPAEGACSRKASVQRYLEKRKDRFKGKTKVKTTTTPSLDLYANHVVGIQAVDELSNRSDMCSSPPIRPPNTPSRCSHFSRE